MGKRATAELRGRIVRAIAQFAGSARIDEYVQAMADAHRFNLAHPERRIVEPFRILGYHTTACQGCFGEGSVATIAAFGLPGEVQHTACGGSGWANIIGSTAAKPLALR